MAQKIKLTRDDEGLIEVDLVSYFELRSNRKRYIFFTRNEVVEEGYKKLYVSEVVPEGLDYRLVKVMSEDDWTNIKGIMRKILTSQVNEELKYLEWGEQ